MMPTLSLMRGKLEAQVDDGGNNGIGGESEAKAEDALEAGCEWFAVKRCVLHMISS